MWYRKKTKGVTLLYAILVIVILSIVLSSSSFLIVQSLQNSFSDKSSQAAYYAALSGAECALYWDNAQLAFGKSSGDHVSELDCFGGSSMTLSDGVFLSNVDMSIKDKNGKAVKGDMIEFTFTAEFPDTPQCADVTVKKGVNEFATVIESRGYHNCDIDIKNRVERGFRAVYGDV